MSEPALRDEPIPVEIVREGRIEFGPPVQIPSYKSFVHELA